MDIHSINIYGIGVRPVCVRTLAGMGTPGSRKKGGEYTWVSLTDSTGAVLTDSTGATLQTYERK